jgi:hypothetical protein
VSWPPGRTALYRLYDADSALLYIGVACNLEARWSGHASTKAWWKDVASRTVEWHDERELAEAAETAAIAAEHPRHNVAKSPWAPKPRELEPDEFLAGDARANLTEIVARVRMLRTVVTIVAPTKARKPIAAVVPAELGEAINAAGGPDVALKLLRQPPAG